MMAPHDSYAWDYRELATLLIPSEGLAEDGFESLTIGSMLNKLTTETYPDTKTRNHMLLPQWQQLPDFGQSDKVTKLRYAGHVHRTTAGPEGSPRGRLEKGRFHCEDAFEPLTIRPRIFSVHYLSLSFVILRQQIYFICKPYQPISESSMTITAIVRRI